MFIKYSNSIKVSSDVINEYNICDTSLVDLTDSKGIIKSPGYPTFNSVDKECVVKIVAPIDRIISIWIPDVNIKSPESNNE